MTNPPRVKGTRAESAAARWLTDELGVTVERGPLRGNADRGDLFGVPDTCVEIKNCKTPNIKAWARELDAEMRNSGCAHGVILWSPVGVGMGNVDKWVALAADDIGRGLVCQYGPDTRLHKFVAHMDAEMLGVLVAAQPEPLAACLAATWLYSVRERMAANA